MEKNKFFRNHLSRMLAAQYLYQYFFIKKYNKDGLLVYEPESLIDQIKEDLKHEVPRRFFINTQSSSGLASSNDKEVDHEVVNNSGNVVEGAVGNVDVEYDRALYVELVEAVIDYFDAIMGDIQKYAVERSVEDIDILTKVLISLAYAEVKILKRIPEKVAIDEAVELDKELNASHMYKFINAVLGKLLGLD